MTTEADDLIDSDGRLDRSAVMREIVELSTYMAQKAGPGNSRRIRDQKKDRTRVKLANCAIRGFKQALEAQEAEDIDEMYERVKNQTEDTSPFVNVDEWE